MTTLVRCECDEAPHIGRIVIARGEAGNAFTMEMVAAVRDALKRFAQDDAIKVIPLGGMALAQLGA